MHKPLGWTVSISYEAEEGEDEEGSPRSIYSLRDDGGYYTLIVNGVKFSEMEEAPPRERADLARSAVKMQMEGPKKSVKFGFLLKG